MPNRRVAALWARMLQLLLPPGYVEWNIDERRRAHVFIGFAAWFILTGIGLSLTGFIVGLYAQAVSAGMGAILILLCLWSFRAGLSLRVVSAVLGLLVFGVATIGAYYFGGWGSAPLNWFAVLPLLGLLISGTRMGIALTVLSALGQITFFVLHRLGLEQTYIENDGVRLGDSLIMLLAMLMLALSYESFRKRATHDLHEAHAKLQREVRKHRQTQTSLETTQQYLVSTARQAGMAEVATGVLHNVGNALTHVATSAALLTDLVNNLSVDGSQRAARKLQQLAPNDLETRALLASYLDKVTESLSQHKTSMQTEVSRLRDAVTAMAAVVEMQQRYAVGNDRSEPVNLAKAIEHLLSLEQDSFKRRAINLSTTLEPIPVTVTNRHKVLMVLVNLLHNALDAVQGLPAETRVVNVHLRVNAEGMIALTVRDNGAGIAAEHQAHIFEQGFTTKRHGHGFGLHTAALAARELGGSLAFESAGVGKGASFTLLLPHHPPVTPT